MQPRFSIVIPFYNGLGHIQQCVQSVVSQGFESIEVLLVDDCDPENTGTQLDALFASDPRIKVIHRGQNGGTLQARRTGVLEAAGEYITLVDQDDSLAPGSLAAMDAELAAKPVEVLHFKAQVIAESAAAEGACWGMEQFLTPPVRELAGEEILEKQFAQQGAFDFHVHHKAYLAELAKKAWGLASNEPFALADDLYMSFIVCSLAQTYRAVDGPWYEYHLGRGETLGEAYSLKQYKRLCAADAQAYRLVEEYANRQASSLNRNDLLQRVADARDRLVEHSMNEMVDNLSLEDRSEAIGFALTVWQPDAVAGELWRYVRDRAYHLYDTGQYPAKRDILWRLLEDAQQVSAKIEGEGNSHYRSLRATAEGHLADLAKNAPLFVRLKRRIAGIFKR
jgi:glycosyltransferase involved in cell wall biosynthesis